MPAETPEEEARAAFSFLAWRLSFSDFLAAVFELFKPPLSFVGHASPSKRNDREFNVSPWNRRSRLLSFEGLAGDAERLGPFRDEPVQFPALHPLKGWSLQDSPARFITLKLMAPPRDVWHEAIGRCSLCPLLGSPIVPAHGPPEPLLVVVGEAPGDKEVEIGKPFVGPAGENLRAALDLVDVDVGSVHFTNATLCYPGKDVVTGEYNHPPTEAVDACRPRLLLEIRATLATKVLAAGGYAGRSLTGRRVVIETSRCIVAGPVQRHLLGDGVDVGVTYHPKARRGNPIADVVSDLRCLLARP